MSKMWTYIPKCGHIPENVDIMSKKWMKHTKMDRILENDTFGLSKSGIGYSLGHKFA